MDDTDRNPQRRRQQVRDECARIIALFPGRIHNTSRRNKHRAMVEKVMFTEECWQVLLEHGLPDDVMNSLRDVPAGTPQRRMAEEAIKIRWGEPVTVVVHGERHTALEPVTVTVGGDPVTTFAMLVMSKELADTDEERRIAQLVKGDRSAPKIEVRRGGFVGVGAHLDSYGR